MTFSQMFRISAFFVMISGVILLEAGRKSLTWIAVFLLLSGLSALSRNARVFFPPRSRQGSIVVWSTCAVLSLAIVVAEQAGSHAFFHVLILVQIFRFFSATKPSHYVQAAGLSLVHVVYACSVSKNFLFFPILLYFTLSSIFFLAMLKIQDHLARHAQRGPAGGTVRVQVDRGFEHGASLNRLFVFSLAAMAYICAVGVFLFLVLPRPSRSQGIGGPPEVDYGSRFKPPRTPPARIPERTTGGNTNPVFADRIVLGRPREGADGAKEGVEVGTVRFFRGDVLVPPPGGRLYFKGAVLDYFDGVRWSRYDERVWRVVDEADGTQDGRVQFGPGRADWTGWMRQDYRLLRSMGDLRFYMETLEGVEGQRALIDAAGTLVRAVPEGGNRYVITYSTYGRQSRTSRWLYRDGDLPEKYVSVPEGHGRVADLARQKTAGVTGEEARAGALADHLRKRCAYSKRPSPPGEDRPLVTFLFETREGNCEFFATALAVMLRSVGVPARVVVGFVGGKVTQDASGAPYVALRESHGHAWVEVHVRGKGWVRYDATPSSGEGTIDLPMETDPALAGMEGGEPRAPETTGEPGRGVVGFVEGYNRRDQRALIRVGFEKVAEGFSSLLRRGGSLHDVWPVLLVVAVLLVLVLSVRRLRRALFRLHPLGRLAGQRQDRPVVHFYAGFLQALSVLGFRRKPEQTPSEFARSVCQRWGEGGEAVYRVTAAFNRARYGREPLSQEEMGAVWEAIQVIRGEGRKRKGPKS